jgi:hypothetical protein
MSDNIPLYIRHEDSATGLPAGTIALQTLATADPVDVINQWGLDVEGVGMVDKDWLSGQFFYEPDGRGFGFEVVVTAPEDAES